MDIIFSSHRYAFFPVGFLKAMFGANRGPRPSVDGLVSVDGLGMAGHPRILRMAWPPSLK